MTDAGIAKLEQRVTRLEKQLAADQERMGCYSNAPRVSASFASLVIIAGVNSTPLSTYLGHASISTTLDSYDHLMPGGSGPA
jgi:site-specific recombinase XerD